MNNDAVMDSHLEAVEACVAQREADPMWAHLTCVGAFYRSLERWEFSVVASARVAEVTADASMYFTFTRSPRQQRAIDADFVRRLRAVE